MPDPRIRLYLIVTGLRREPPDLGGFEFSIAETRTERRGLCPPGTQSIRGPRASCA